MPGLGIFVSKEESVWLNHFICFICGIYYTEHMFLSQAKICPWRIMYPINNFPIYLYCIGWTSRSGGGSALLTPSG